MKKTCNDKRSALLQAALELFAERGFDASPTALIAKRAGVASGTLFLYFKNKEELIREVFHGVRTKIDRIFLESSEEMPIQERLLQVLSGILRYFLENPKEFKFIEQYHYSPLCELECRTTGENAKFRGLLIQARKQGIVKDAPLLVLEAIAFGPIAAFAKEHASRGVPIEDSMIEQIIQACWDGLKS